MKQKLVRRPLKEAPLKWAFKAFILSFSLWYAVFSTVVPYATFAQTPDPTPTPTPVASPQPTAEAGTPTPTPTGTPTPTPTDTASPTPTPDPTIVTGNATSSAIGVGASNLSQTQVAADCGGCESPSPSPSSTPSLDVNTTQTATSAVTASSSATTGNNSVLSDAQVTILTGLALAIANSINVANVNLVGSNLLSIIQTILGKQTGDINLYKMFEALLANSPASLPANTTITTNQTSNLQTTTAANADTGQNSATGSAVNVTTGDAGALANSVNVTNLNFVGSNAVFAILNILGSLNGDIILPNGSHLALPGGGGGNTTVLTTQSANVQSSSNANSNTGTNSIQGGTSNLTTGNATSLANTQSFANLVRIGNSGGFLIINNFGSWLGNLVNWGTPGESVTLGNGTHTLENTGGGSGGGCTGCGNLTVVTNQNATVQSSTTANSNTGGNSVTGSGSITTGNAFSYANDFTLANMVGVGGGFFFGIVNVLGSWMGNLEVAYPDLTVSVTDGLTQNTPGSPENYTLTVTNQGKAKASSVNLNFSANSEFIPSGPPTTTWHLDSLEPGQSHTYSVGGFLSSTALANTNLVATASVSTVDTESNTGNNSANHSTLVVIPNPGPKDARTPNLHVSIWNNVHDFVYPGDTVLASITVANESPFPARDVKVRGRLTNDHPMPAIPMSWDIGDLKPGERVKISFSIGLIRELPGGTYHLSAEATGKSESGDSSGSGNVVSDFLVRLREFAEALAPEVIAGSNEGSSGQVLGASTQNSNPIDIRKFFPYILAISGLVLIIIPALRRKLQREQEKNDE